MELRCTLSPLPGASNALRLVLHLDGAALELAGGDFDEHLPFVIDPRKTTARPFLESLAAAWSVPLPPETPGERWPARVWVIPLSRKNEALVLKMVLGALTFHLELREDGTAQFSAAQEHAASVAGLARLLGGVEPPPGAPVYTQFTPCPSGQVTFAGEQICDREVHSASPHGPLALILREGEPVLIDLAHDRSVTLEAPAENDGDLEPPAVLWDGQTRFVAIERGGRSAIYQLPSGELLTSIEGTLLQAEREGLLLEVGDTFDAEAGELALWSAATNTVSPATWRGVFSPDGLYAVETTGASTRVVDRSGAAREVPFVSRVSRLGLKVALGSSTEWIGPHGLKVAPRPGERHERLLDLETLTTRPLFVDPTMELVAASASGRTALVRTVAGMWMYART